MVAKRDNSKHGNKHRKKQMHSEPTWKNKPRTQLFPLFKPSACIFVFDTNTDERQADCTLTRVYGALCDDCASGETRPDGGEGGAKLTPRPIIRGWAEALRLSLCSTATSPFQLFSCSPNLLPGRGIQHLCGWRRLVHRYNLRIADSFSFSGGDGF